MSNFNFEYMGDYLQYKDAKGNTLIVNGGIINETATGQVAEITDGAENIPVKSLVVTMNPIQEGSGDPSPENVRPISGRTTIKVWRESTYDTSAEPVLSIQLGDIIYSGTVDVISGVLTVDMAIIDGGTLTWNVTGASGFYSNAISDAKAGSSGSGFDLVISSSYKSENTASVGTLSDCAISMDSARHIQIKDARYTDAASFKTAMDGVQLCYELAQPITVQLTPQQLTTLLGTNYIWSYADSVSVDYVADTKLYIQNAIADSVSDSI